MLESQDQNEEVEVEPRRSKRVRTEKSFGPDFLTFMLEGEPQTFKEAVNSTEGLMWKEAIKSEIDSILQNHTWELVDLPPGCKPLSSKWIFKRKMKVDGSIDKYKARLVIKGYRQTEGLDYFDTYSPVTRINSIRMVLAIAALRNLEIHQMDVKTAFLNGDLDEEIYMEQPEGFSAPGQEKKVYDMLIVGSDDKMITSTKNMLNSRFDMKDMGLADVILGIKIKRTSNELILNIAYAVGKLSRYTSNPGAKHWQGIIRVLKYLRFTRELWAALLRDILLGAAVSWKSSKQTVIARSTMESEFIALDKCGEEAEWLRHFLEDIPRWSKPVLQFAYIVIVNLQLVEHRVICIMKNFGVLSECLRVPSFRVRDRVEQFPVRRSGCRVLLLPFEDRFILGDRRLAILKAPVEKANLF
ncbi:Retrovirus-related Pol polyprotein from transposon TNT 1-94 [Vitis vinifera]|uniref:Retrovirus-related Pol polyprotein from transposon TNT 1-94 n=1 Tax=Vitis vinifera TaxID=29760 RepID=A0A438EK95_VITVI|nr:Retrovirus-related Pol polyprotein from transposon TNT 1-94 [Vitis vinifera]